MNKVNYQKELEKILADNLQRGSRLFIHSCCAPCSSYVLTYLSSFFNITVFYYNPNITDDEEYHHRVLEQKRLIDILNKEDEASYPEWAFCKEKRFLIQYVDFEHDKEKFYDCASGFEREPEGGARCARCFRLRLERTALEAIKYNADYFATTLTISPLKNSELINSIGYSLEKQYGIKWLPSDFKKKEGYKHSIELSKQYDLYRQNYCGCEYSAQDIR